MPGGAPQANSNAETHGAFSRRRWGALADEVVRELPDRAPWVLRPAFLSAVRRYARAEAVADLLAADLDEHGVVDAEGNVRPAVTALAAWDRRAELAGAQLGLDPVSLAKVLAQLTGMDGGDDDALARLRAEGRKIVEARAALSREGTTTPQDATDGDAGSSAAHEGDGDSAAR